MPISEETLGRFDDDDQPSPPDPEAEDDLFGVTVVRSVEDAAVRPAAETLSTDTVRPAEDSGAQREDLGDHDGQTIFGADLERLRAGVVAGASEADSPNASQGAEPELLLVADSGDRIPLLRTVIIGRAPTVLSPTAPGDLPDLVTVADPDVSRNHVRIAVEGGTVVVTDLHSRQRDDRDPARPLPGAAAPGRRHPGDRRHRDRPRWGYDVHRHID